MPSASELPIDTSASAAEMADAIFGTGVDILSSSYSGAGGASGIFSDGNNVVPDLTPSDSGVILSTGKAKDITNSDGEANTKSYTSTDNQTAGDSDLEDLAGVKTFDAAIFEANFVPQGSTLTMQVTFSSEEYLEYVGSGFNDAVGIWVNGEPAVLTVGDGDITINNINDEQNENLYIDNPASAEVANTEMDGFTVKLTLKAPVAPGEENTIKIAIADGGDRSYDSNLLIAGDSIQTALIAGDDTVSVSGSQPGNVDVLSNDASTVGGSLTITHINGHPVVAGDTVALATGEEITLNPDGSFDVVSDGDAGSNAFTYTVEDSDGNTDTAFVTVSSGPGVACFVAGTMIETVTGAVPVEDLHPGQLVVTRDNGMQPVRWIGTSTRRATGQYSPVIVAANVFGDHDQTALSPNHRVLIRSEQSEMMFGHCETLVKIGSLINGSSIRIDHNGCETPYFHLLFDQHEIVSANGLLSESYHPGRETIDGFDVDTRDEILNLLPELRWSRHAHIGPLARPELRAFEAALIGCDYGRPKKSLLTSP